MKIFFHILIILFEFFIAQEQEIEIVNQNQLRSTANQQNAGLNKTVKSYYSANLQNNNFRSFYFSNFNNRVNDQGAGITVPTSQFFEPQDTSIIKTNTQNPQIPLNNNFPNQNQGQNLNSEKNSQNQQNPQIQVNFSGPLFNPNQNSQQIQPPQQPKIDENQKYDPFRAYQANQDEEPQNKFPGIPPNPQENSLQPNSLQQPNSQFASESRISISQIPKNPQQLQPQSTSQQPKHLQPLKQPQQHDPDDPNFAQQVINGDPFAQPSHQEDIQNEQQGFPNLTFIDRNSENQEQPIEQNNQDRMRQPPNGESLPFNQNPQLQDTQNSPQNQSSQQKTSSSQPINQPEDDITRVQRRVSPQNNQPLSESNGSLLPNSPEYNAILNSNPLTVQIPTKYFSQEEAQLYQILTSLQESPVLIQNPQIPMLLEQLQKTPSLKENPYLQNMIQFINKQNESQQHLEKPAPSDPFSPNQQLINN